MSRGSSPQDLRRRGIVSLTFTLLCTLALLCGPGRANADELRSPADLDGVYLSLGPVGSALRIEGAWDGAFGGEVSLSRVREHQALSALGLSLGGAAYSQREGGLLWGDLFAATLTPLGAAVGLSAGFTAEVHPVRPPRLGAQATLWVFAGVIPYARIGRVETAGTFVDVGVKIALPAIRF